MHHHLSHLSHQTNTMSWTDSTNPNYSNYYGGSRATRPSYVPPHQRNPYNNMTRNSTRPTRGGGRGGGGGGGFGYNNNPNGSGSRRQPPPPPPRTTNPPRFQQNFDAADKFADLGVNDEEEEIPTGGINFDAYEDIPVETSGKDIPAAVNTFGEIDLGEALNLNIKRCKYVKPTPVQRHAIPIAIAGRDLMACAQTGSGKTAAFCFPIISGIMKRQMRLSSVPSSRTASPLALILSPTRELSIQIYEEVKKFSHQTGVKVVVAYGGAPMHQQLRELERGVDILVATPGRLVDLIERAKVSLRTIGYLALDEADRMLDMGFEPQIRKIVEQMDMPRAGVRQTLLFSATFPTEIQKLASDFLSNYIFLAVGKVGSSTDLIEQRVELVEDNDKRSHLMNVLHDQRQKGRHGKHALTLVFVETKRGADSLERWLCMKGFPATAIHGDKVQMERERALKLFKSGATPVLVATDVAARGLDIPHVAHVINFDLPKDIDDYVHRIGRTGRAGKSGLATAFFSEGNQSMAKALVELMQEAKQEVPVWLTEFAQKPSYGGGGRNRRYGGGRFGGYDYRQNSSSSGGDYYSSSYGGDSSATASYSYDASGTDYPPLPTPSSHEYGFDHGNIVASGWD